MVIVVLCDALSLSSNIRSRASGQTGEEDSDKQEWLWHLKGDRPRNLQRGERVCAGSVVKRMSIITLTEYIKCTGGSGSHA